MRGVPLKVIQERMGHATSEMTMRYAYLAPEARESAVQQFDRPVPLQLHAAPATDAGGPHRGHIGGQRKAQHPLRIAGLSMARSTGLEPVASGTTGRRSNPLNQLPTTLWAEQGLNL